MFDLLDTNVVSELIKLRPSRFVLDYLDNTNLRNLFISTLTLAEIRLGIEVAVNLERKNRLNAWLHDELIPMFAERILPVSESVMVRWLQLTRDGRRANFTFSQPDLLLAATALEYDLTFVTRNTKDFSRVPGLRLLNPWQASVQRLP